MPSTTESKPRLSGVTRWLAAIHGVYLILAGTALAGLSWLLPDRLAKLGESGAIDQAEIPWLGRLVIDHRGWLPLLAVPVVIFGLLLTTGARLRWVWLILGAMSLLIPAALLIYTAVVWIGSLYVYRPL